MLDGGEHYLSTFSLDLWKSWRSLWALLDLQNLDLPASCIFNQSHIWLKFCTIRFTLDGYPGLLQPACWDHNAHHWPTVALTDPAAVVGPTTAAVKTQNMMAVIAMMVVKSKLWLVVKNSNHSFLFCRQRKLRTELWLVGCTSIASPLSQLLLLLEIIYGCHVNAMVVGVQRGSTAVSASATSSVQSPRTSIGAAKYWCQNWRQHRIHYIW